MHFHSHGYYTQSYISQLYQYISKSYILMNKEDYLLNIIISFSLGKEFWWALQDVNSNIPQKNQKKNLRMSKFCHNFTKDSSMAVLVLVSYRNSNRPIREHFGSWILDDNIVLPCLITKNSGRVGAWKKLIFWIIFVI